MKPHRILKNFPGSQTGHDHDQFEEGTIRDLSDDLAAVAIRHGLAEPVRKGHPAPSVEVAEPEEEKSQGDAPANKMKKGAPENKGKKGD